MSMGDVLCRTFQVADGLKAPFVRLTIVSPVGVEMIRWRDEALATGRCKQKIFKRRTCIVHFLKGIQKLVTS